MKEIDKIALIHIENKQILSSRSKGKNVFYIPGGKREGIETDLETLVRESKEELSVDIIPESVVYYGTFRAHAHGHEDDIIVKMTCYFADFLGLLHPDNEIEEIRWLSYEDRGVSSEVDKMIFEKLYSDHLLE